MEVVADTVGSIGVLIAGIVTVTTRWPYADVVVAVLVALWVLPRAFALARAALRILSESSPSHIDVDELRTALAAVDGVTGVHDLHVWTLVPGKDMATAHVTCCGDSAQVLETPGRCWPPVASSTPPSRWSRPRAPATATAQPTLVSRCELSPGRARRAPRDRSRRAGPGSAVLVGLTDRVGGPGQRGHATQEAAVGFVREGHRAVPLPPVAPQLIQSAVIAGPGVGVGGDRLVVGRAPPRRASPTPPRPTDARPQRSPGSHRRPARPRLRCRQAAAPDPAPADHPSASWAYCAVRILRGSRGIACGGWISSVQAVERED